jgi:protease-4
MKKTRIGGSILLLIVLMALFVALAVGLSKLFETEEKSSGLIDALDYGSRIGIIPIEGTIMTSDEILKDLRKFQKKSSIKAIVLRINSPGGAVAPAQEIYREIEKIKKKKPIVASMETVGASAAYYIASNATRVVCSRGTITGSIGVIMMLPDIHKIAEKIGVGVNIVKAGKFKDIGSGFKPLTEDEKNLLETFAVEIHDQFIADVATGRKEKIEINKLREIADGRFFSGEKAREYGLVDNIGNFYDAVQIAAELGGVKGDPQLEYPKKKWNNYLDMVLESASTALVGFSRRAGLVGSPEMR